MANELVNLEQVQANAITHDVQRQIAMDNVTLFVSTIEAHIRKAESELNELIPLLQKSVDSLTKDANDVIERGCKARKIIIAKKYAKLADTLRKSGFKNVSVLVNNCGTDDKSYKFEVALQQSGTKQTWRTDELWFGDGQDNKQYVHEPLSEEAMDAQARVREEIAKLTEAQKKLLELKVQAQDIGRHEREGKALVIKAERTRTKEGSAMVTMVENAAAEKCDNIAKYVAALSKSMKALTGKK